MEQTLEEASKQLYPIEYTGRMFMPNRDELNNSYKQEAFIEGAKWQQERMYSEEDILEAMEWARTFSSKMKDVDFIKLFKKQ
jgi:hypothetical protein